MADELKIFLNTLKANKVNTVTANWLKSQNGTLFFARVKTGQVGTWSLIE